MFTKLANTPLKKILLVLGFIVIVIGIGFLLYILFFKPTPLPPLPPEKKEITLSQLPSKVLTGKEKKGLAKIAQKKGLKKITKIGTEELLAVDQIAQGGLTAVNTLSTDTIKSFKVAHNGLLYGYDQETGAFYKITATGEKELLTDKIYKNVENITWAPDDEQAILEFPDGSNILFNFVTGQQITLPKSWTEFSFSPDGKRIGFKDIDSNPKYNWFAIANADGSQQNYIDYMGDAAPQVISTWSPNNQFIALFKTTGNAVSTKIRLIGLHGEDFQAFYAKGFGFQPQWSPQGDKLLYSAYNAAENLDPYLYVVNVTPGTIGYDHKKINLKTWANKCTFADNNTVYCAVPKELPDHAGPVPEVANNIPDYIYKINLITGQTSLVAEPELNYTVDKMQISPDGTYLYFTDKETQMLFSIQLK